MKRLTVVQTENQDENITCDRKKNEFIKCPLYKVVSFSSYITFLNHIAFVKYNIYLSE